MHLSSVFAFCLLTLVVVSCKSQDPDMRSSAPGASSRPAARPTSRPVTLRTDERGRYERFGGELASGNVPIVPAGDLIRGLDGFEGKTVRVAGRVESTCPKKGCWMWVGKGVDRVFVRFQDYAFFVPTEGAEGRSVVFEGVVSNKTMSVAEARHYAEDAGDFDGAKQITEERKVPFVMATAVRMYDAK